jgi:cyclomaltodextrinase
MTRSVWWVIKHLQPKLMEAKSHSMKSCTVSTKVGFGARIKLGKYQHFKGDVMEVIGKAFHSETMEEFVVYKHITGEHAGEEYYWVRPVKMFLEEVEIGGKMVPRFKYLG